VGRISAVATALTTAELAAGKIDQWYLFSETH
jgi:hypothetical protein